MSSSSRIALEEASRVELPVFLSSTELAFSPTRRRALLTIYNPYGKDAQYQIMTTSRDRFDLSSTRGTIKSNRRIDITVRLYSHKVEELSKPGEESEMIDYFRVFLQLGQLKGNKQVKVNWGLSSNDTVDSEEIHPLAPDDKSSRNRIKTPKPISSNPTSYAAAVNSAVQRSTRATVTRANRQVDHLNGSNNVNLVCTLCAVACVITLFLPLSIDSELCKKAQLQQEQVTSQISGLLSQLTNIFSVSYEMKLGCSFALGLFTYRLISTMPD